MALSIIVLESEYTITLKIESDRWTLPVDVLEYGTKSFYVNRVQLHYRFEETSWVLKNVQVSGPRILKDGEPGSAIHSRYYYNRQTAGMPQWMWDLAENNRPGV